jgi:nucleophosmin 1
MFWAVALKPGASHTLPEGTDLLHVSQACLAETKEGKCQLQVNDNNVTYTIAVLEKDKNEMASLDLFFNTVAPPTFINKGKSEIHLSGYYEMSNDMGSEEDMESEDEEIESEIEEEEEISSAPAARAAITGASKKAVVEAEEEDEEEEDSDDLEDEDDLEDDDDMEDDDEDEEEDDEEEDDEEDEEESELEEEQPKLNNKRPAAPVKSAQPAAKNQKTTESNPETFAKAVVAFLKTKDGKSSISAVGGSVQKPAAVPKLKQFLSSRKEFKVNADTVELA